jgi:hypothetical protein
MTRPAIAVSGAAVQAIAKDNCARPHAPIPMSIIVLLSMYRTKKKLVMTPRSPKQETMVL